MTHWGGGEAPNPNVQQVNRAVASAGDRKYPRPNNVPRDCQIFASKCNTAAKCHSGTRPMSTGHCQAVGAPFWEPKQHRHSCPHAFTAAIVHRRRDGPASHPQDDESNTGRCDRSTRTKTKTEDVSNLETSRTPVTTQQCNLISHPPIVGRQHSPHALLSEGSIMRYTDTVVIHSGEGCIL